MKFFVASVKGAPVCIKSDTRSFKTVGAPFNPVIAALNPSCAPVTPSFSKSRKAAIVAPSLCRASKSSCIWLVCCPVNLLSIVKFFAKLLTLSSWSSLCFFSSL